MSNIDLSNILPLLNGGKNIDIMQMLSAMGKIPGVSMPPYPEPPPCASQATPETPLNNHADYSKLYPGGMGNGMGSGMGGGMDMNNLVKMMSLLNAQKNRQMMPNTAGNTDNAGGSTGNVPEHFQTESDSPYYTAPREIQESLRILLSLEGLSPTGRI